MSMFFDLCDAMGLKIKDECNKAIGFCRMTICYETSRGDDYGLREPMKLLANERRRLGY
ncbi:hypothetical protein [Rhizobium laguerreae]|uniref:hypothetical protein n=1 Tax=Rhizobium laguerreae TaxID=1076926 RepID=UPI001C91D1A5|nr:hypothetical protein [Rhizobium laguerreae]MBY3220941.1 hypothetical protein [Rhizobium laguerreae]